MWYAAFGIQDTPKIVCLIKNINGLALMSIVCSRLTLLCCLLNVFLCLLH